MKTTSHLVKSPALPPEVVRVALATALLTAGFGLQACHRRGADSDQALTLSGNLEVVDAQLGFKIPGRVVARLVSEGERVKEGQLIARLDDAEQLEQLKLRQAELAAAQAALAELEAGSRPQEIVAAEATLHSAEAERDRLKVDYHRFEELRSKDVVAARDFEVAQAQLKVAEAKVVEAAERLKLVKEGPRVETIQQARARVQQAKASVELAQTQVDNTQLFSPLTGVVLSHNIEAGEYVSPGTPVVTVADIAHPWVRAYVSQTDLGRLKHGQGVSVRTDAFPDKTYHGTVAFIASEAEFTPKTVQTTKERVKLVFRIKVDVANPNDELKPGMAADVIVDGGPSMK